MATTQKELIELVQQHFPNKGHVEIRKMLNRAQDEICSSAEPLQSFLEITTVAGTRFYTPAVDIIKISRVEMQDENGQYFQIPRLLGSVSSNGD